ncbi:unnamed protein product [Hyaloperonospora brassicae]|uniref:HTH psq-type domain-containing protein n=1 Tax=Hyaloperonospora brassicae TaxID=162125 RepID=A0AAV0ULW9_HYABA|nr:unnamed protein product [Hyaloperonospora brassicae]
MPAPAGDPCEMAAAVEDKAQGRRRPNLTDEERLVLANYLLQHRQGESRLPRAVIATAADKFQVHRNTVSRIWSLMKLALDSGSSIDVVMRQVLSRKRGNCGRKRKDYSTALEQVKQLPLNQRGSLRALSSAVGVPRTTLFRLLRNYETDDICKSDNEEARSEVKPTTANTIKPALSEKNKRERLRFCYRKMQPNGVFDNMFNVVHINTKWCLLPGARDAETMTNKKKRKVMFLIAVARPQWDTGRQKQFDGKLGVWPCIATGELTLTGTDVEVSAPSVVDSAKTGRVLRVLETVTKTEIQAMITHHVIPAIKLKMPNALRTDPVFIQMDNQQMRLTADDPVVAEHGSTDGWDIRVQYQPAHSPELVVLSHALLKSIYPATFPSQRGCTPLSPVEALIAGMERTFAAVPKRRINNAFLALQKTMECVMLAGGSNNFDSQEDATKQSLQADGSLPVSVLCQRDAIAACQCILNSSQE